MNKSRRSIHLPSQKFTGTLARLAALYLLLAMGGFLHNTAQAKQGDNVTTLTFHLIASDGRGRAVLGGSLEGPADNPAQTVELVVQFFKLGQILETKTLSVNPLSWPKANFRLPIPNDLDCYDIVALRAFDQHHQLLNSVDATTELLKPGRCQR
ncbi:hypothetical protein D3C84_642450 [compost metagenome]